MFKILLEIELDNPSITLRDTLVGEDLDILKSQIIPKTLSLTSKNKIGFGDAVLTQTILEDEIYYDFDEANIFIPEDYSTVEFID